MTSARTVRVRGVVQGVGFRPFVFRLARANSLAGWVLNEPYGVDIHLEGAEAALDAFLSDLEREAPTGARIAAVEVDAAEETGLNDFMIRESQAVGRPSVRISPDLPVCDDCLAELFDPSDPRYLYPYINCTNCGPRYTVIESLPYDRAEYHACGIGRWTTSARLNTPIRSIAAFMRNPSLAPSCGPNYLLEPAANAGAIETAGSTLARRPDRRHQRHWRLSSGLRCEQRAGCSVAARTQVPERETIRGDGAGHRYRRPARRAFRRSRSAAHIRRSPHRAGAGHAGSSGSGSGQFANWGCFFPTLRCIICSSRPAHRKFW